MTAEMRTLLERASAGDRSAEAQLIEENSGLIWSIARRYYGRGAEPDDLYQLACVGFIKAVRGFEPARGNEFSTYAVPKIAGEIRRFLRDDGAVKVSRALKERSARVRRVQSELESKTGRSPTVCGAGRSRRADAPKRSRPASRRTWPWTRLSASCPAAVGWVIWWATTAWRSAPACICRCGDAVRSLPAREQQVLALRFSRDLTQQQVSRIIGVSQVQVSRIEKRAIQALREKLTESE